MVISKSYLRWVDGKPLDFIIKEKKTNHGISFRMLKKNSTGRYIQNIGKICLEYVYWDKEYVETHFPKMVPYKYRNKRIGIYLYSYAIDYAIENGLRISSSVQTSDAAKRVWKSKLLRKYYNIKRKNLRYWPTRKENDKISKNTPHNNITRKK